MNALDLARTLLALDAKATGRPWAVHKWDERTNGRVISFENPLASPLISVLYRGGTGEPTDTAALIVALRNNLPALLDALCVAAAVEEWLDHGDDKLYKDAAHERAAELKASLEESK